MMSLPVNKKRRKRRILIAFVIFTSLLVVLWFAGRITGAFQFYRIPSSSMEPALKPASLIFATNLKKPKRNDIIVFKRIITEKEGFTESGKKLSFTYRLIAFGGETVQIKNGLAYVNGELMDDSTRLQFTYMVEKKDIEKVATALKKDLNDLLLSPMTYFQEQNQFVLTLTYKEFLVVKEFTNPVKELSDDFTNELFENNNEKNWKVNNYGPIIIPSNCYFVLGDNRCFSFDSRFHGPIPEKDFIGVVLWK